MTLKVEIEADVEDKEGVWYEKNVEESFCGRLEEVDINIEKVVVTDEEEYDGEDEEKKENEDDDVKTEDIRVDDEGFE